MDAMNQDKYYYLLRLTRLYANGVFRNVDKSLHPQITLFVSSFGDFEQYFYVDTIPKNEAYQALLAENKENLQEKFLESFVYTQNMPGEKIMKQEAPGLKQALAQMFRKAYGKDKTYLISDIAIIDNLIVCMMTEIFFKKMPEVPSSYRGITFFSSLCEEYLEDLNRFLRQYARDEALEPVDYIKTIRNAGEHFIRHILPESKGDNLYNKLNVISSLRNEGEESKGKIYFVPQFQKGDMEKTHFPLTVSLALSTPIAISKYRGIRKLLELSKGENGLISDAKFIYGLGKPKALSAKRPCKVVEVRFLKHYIWEVRSCRTALMSVSHEQPEIPKSKIQKNQFEHLLKRLYPNLDLKTVKDLYELINKASNQTHGTIVVLSDYAKEEAERLMHQCIPVQKFKMTPELMSSVSGIDGAVLMDALGYCYAIGVILDGLASEYGTSARGARYNSSVRYVETMSIKRANHKCLAFVISEDGMLDIISPYDFVRRESHLKR